MLALPVQWWMSQQEMILTGRHNSAGCLCPCPPVICPTVQCPHLYPVVPHCALLRNVITQTNVATSCISAACQKLYKWSSGPLMFVSTDNKNVYSSCQFILLSSAPWAMISWQIAKTALVNISVGKWIIAVPVTED